MKRLYTTPIVIDDAIVVEQGIAASAGTEDVGTSGNSYGTDDFS